MEDRQLERDWCPASKLVNLGLARSTSFPDACGVDVRMIGVLCQLLNRVRKCNDGGAKNGRMMIEETCAKLPYTFLPGLRNGIIVRAVLIPRNAAPGMEGCSLL